ncbi:MAG: hypothetical protein ABW252_08055 [Polyangiales bacterium]
MRVELEPVEQFLQLIRDNRPCPRCGSLRVVVRRESRDAKTVLRSECADCHHQGELGMVMLK